MAYSHGCHAACVFLACLLLLFSLSPPILAQQITYEYDALGRLTVVASPEGVAQYEYDAIGNILQITTHRYAEVSGPVAILMVNPTKGAPGTSVQIYGRGFATTPSDNQVAFNGTATPVTVVTTTSLTVMVPAGATTGLITLATPQGSATSPEPFTILQGFVVVPDQASALLGKTYSFQAVLDGTPTSAVTWRVNGRVGGTTQLGTIGSAGLYTAPASLPPVSPLTIEAVLAADPTRIASAQMTLLPPAAGGVAATRLSVGPAQSPPTASPWIAPSLSVGPTAPGITLAPLGASNLSVGPPPPVSMASPLVASLLSVSPIPVISGVAPGTGSRGSSVTVTLMGAGLAEATALVVLRSGSADSLITMSNLSATPEGTSLTATLTIDATAPVGGRILQVTAAGQTSTALGTGRNAFTVQ